MEETLNLANVASIYKKGDSTSLSNYRPISLLQTAYKILASLIKERIAAGIDDDIYKTQYGFRKDKSTAQAIYVARRLLDLSDRQGTNLTMILLDWEKAFDKIDQDRMLEALKRLCVPDRILKLIKLIYTKPMFRVVCGNNKSEYRQQKTGIRQGCPLSPYLFVLVMSVMFKDIKARLNTPKQKEPIKGIEFAEVLYADDTLLFGTHTQNINILLKQIQVESTYYNMRLNLDKCINITSNQKKTSVKFQDGKMVPREAKAKYLGTILSDDNDNHAELNNRIADCSATANRMKIFWGKANTTIKWKLQVYDAIIRSKLLHGLECIQLTQRDQDRINTHQMKGIRRILGVPPTHISKEEGTTPVTNVEAWAMAEKEKGGPITKFTDMWHKQKMKLLGHVIRASDEDPMRQVSFEKGTIKPKATIAKQGRPRQQWILSSLDEALKLIENDRNISFDPDNEHHRMTLEHFAKNRTGVFATKGKYDKKQHLPNS